MQNAVRCMARRPHPANQLTTHDARTRLHDYLRQLAITGLNAFAVFQFHKVAEARRAFCTDHITLSCCVNRRAKRSRNIHSFVDRRPCMRQTAKLAHDNYI